MNIEYSNNMSPYHRGRSPDIPKLSVTASKGFSHHPNALLIKSIILSKKYKAGPLFRIQQIAARFWIVIYTG